MKKLLLILSLSPLFSFSQDVKIVKFKDIEQIIKSDTSKLLVINFWATWCGPCVKELSNFVKADSIYKKDGVKVLLVSLDYPNKLSTSLQPFLEKRKIKTETVLLDETNANSWIDKVDPSWGGTIPATLMVNPKKERFFFEKEFSLEELEEVVKGHLK